jgi:hypothetical protein
VYFKLGWNGFKKQVKITEVTSDYKHFYLYWFCSISSDKAGACTYWSDDNIKSSHMIFTVVIVSSTVWNARFFILYFNIAKN